MKIAKREKKMTFVLMQVYNSEHQQNGVLGCWSLE